MLLKNRYLIWCLATGAVSALALAPNRAQAATDPAEKERELIAVLRSDSPPDQKAITCKRLAVYGTEEAVPALAPLLLDKDLASWARIALEAIPGEAADAALRAAMPKLQGRLLVGTINSIGVRRDGKAVGELSLKLNDNDAEVASAAAVALGRIGGAQAAGALKDSLPGATAEVRPSVAEGCIRCAERFLADGQVAPAVGLYDVVRHAEVPKQKVLEAIRGAILARGAEGIVLLVEQLQSQDKALFGIGLRTARELPGTKATEAVVAEMHRATAERQPLLLLALADRGDEAALPTIFEAAKSGPKKLQMVAVSVLDRMGKMSSVPVLIEVAAEPDPELAQAALVALTRMPGNELDAKLLDQLGKASGKTRRVLIELSARRQIEGAVPMIVKYAQDPSPTIRSAAIQALGAIGGANQVNELVNLLSTAQNAKQRQDIEQALLAISGRLGESSTHYLLPLAHNEDSSVRKVALHAFASAGGSEALTAVKRAVDDKDETVQDEAVRTLATWPNTWPEDEAIAPSLLDLAKNSKKNNYKVLALRGYLQYLQGDKKLKNEDKIAKIQEALPLMSRPEEKQLAIAVVQSVPTAGALELLVNLSGEPSVLEDACSAIVDIATRNIPGVAAADRRKALQTALEKSNNEATKRKATAALAKIG